MDKKVLSNDNVMKVNNFITLITSYASAVDNIKDINPIMLWGSPGVGKSQAMKQVGINIGEKLNKKVVFNDVRLILFSPVDLRGIPVADTKKQLAVWLKPQILNLDDSEDVINLLILDEISAAPPSVQASAYQIVLDRQIGEHKIPDNTLIMCAGNRVTDKSVAYNMPKALANRLCHIDIEPDLEDWKIWAYKNEVDHRILGYLNYKGLPALHNFDPSTKCNSFATPRSWEKIDKILKVLPLKQSIPLISGIVGTNLCFDFITFTSVYDKLPPIEEIIDGTCTVVETKPDVNFALISALVSRTLKLTNVQLENIFKYSFLMNSEYQVFLIKEMSKVLSGEGQTDRLVDSETFKKFLKKNGHLMNSLISK